MSYHLTPLEVCQRLIGAPDKIAKICGLQEKATYPWRRKSEWQDAGDIRATKYQRALLTYAKANAIPLTPEHLIFGADSAEIDQLVASAQVAA